MTNSNSSRDHHNYLKQLNKLSHKISKPIIKKPSLESHQTQNNTFHPPPRPVPVIPQLSQPMHNPQQPPVYNIDKNNFREVVQRLTGCSPAQERLSTPSQPPPIQAHKPPSSRLQRNRPPPLAPITNRPPPQMAPISPLPPLPAVHAAAESPVSAYMRYLRNELFSSPNSNSNPKEFSAFSPLAPRVSPRWDGVSQQVQVQQPHGGQQQQQQQLGNQAQFQLPPSQMPFGCLNSPLFSQSLLLSTPTGGFPQLPPSPTVPVTSPKWR